MSSARLEQVAANAIRAELLGSGFPRLEAGRVRDVQVPTLLVCGRDSPRLFHLLTDRLEELLPRAARIAIGRASHMMHEDNAPEFDAAVLSFLAGVDRG